MGLVVALKVRRRVRELVGDHVFRADGVGAHHGDELGDTGEVIATLIEGELLCIGPPKCDLARKRKRPDTGSGTEEGSALPKGDFS